MGFFSDFFAASDTEFVAGFPHRHSVEKELRLCKTTNPFTGKVVQVDQWCPITPVPNSPAGLVFPAETEKSAFQRLPHMQWKNLTPVELAQIHELLENSNYDDAFQEILRLEIVTPGAEDAMYLLPSTWVERIGRATDLDVPATRWCETHQAEFDPWTRDAARELLGELQQLARTALETNRKVYCWVTGF
jgi:hypothetical protein